MIIVMKQNASKEELAEVKKQIARWKERVSQAGAGEVKQH